MALLLDPASRDRTRVTLAEGLDVASALQKIADSSRRCSCRTLQAAAAQTSALGLPRLVGRAGWRASCSRRPTTSSPARARRAAARDDGGRFGQAAPRPRPRGSAPPRIGQSPYAVLIIASLIEKETALRRRTAPRSRGSSTTGWPRDAAAVRLDGQLPARRSKKARLTPGRPQAGVALQHLPQQGPAADADRLPGQAALEAALTPAAGDWIYFVTVEQGRLVAVHQRLPRSSCARRPRRRPRASTDACGPPCSARPVGHSLSPALHRAAYAALGLRLALRRGRGRPGGPAGAASTGSARSGPGCR